MLDTFTYNPLTGVILRKFPRGKTKVKAVGTVDNGYMRVRFNNTHILAHRLAWFLYYGEFPKNKIDHINHNGLDNRIKNLRDVTHTKNMQNKAHYKNNSSGVIGVVWTKKAKRWVSTIQVNNERVYLGGFVKFSDAVNARKNAEVLYGFHKNHGEDKC